MNNHTEMRELRLKIYWYTGLLVLPLLIVLVLVNADPYKNVRFSEVLELRQTLNQQQIGQEVIDFLDREGGRNISADQLASLQQASGADIYFMLSTARFSDSLRTALTDSYSDGYITRGEAESYHSLATIELSKKEILGRFGL